MKAFAGNFGWWATTGGSYQIRWLSRSSGEKLYEYRIKYSEVLCYAGQGTWRAVALIQQSTCLTRKDLEHAKTSDDLTGAIHIFEAEPVLSIEHDQASMTLSVTNRKAAFKPWTKKSSYLIMKHHMLGQHRRIRHGFIKFPFPSEICCQSPGSKPSALKGHLLGSCTRQTGALLSVGGSQQYSRSAHLTSQNRLG